ncbi:MAG: aspartate kinase [Bacteroidales bacterium]|nr:aspartate kinase [Bacteroidales bacterium]
MKVLKFGGTSVGSADKIKNVAKIINDDEEKIVVLSAMSGTTNKLEEIATLFLNGKKEEAVVQIELLKKNYYQVVKELFKSDEYQIKGQELIKQHFDNLLSFTKDVFTRYEERAVLAQGELLSTALLQFYLEEQKIKSTIIPALNFMRIDKSLEPDEYYIRENLKRELAQYPNIKLFITQGYICRNAFGEIDNLKRGGSDFTASLIGAELGADEIQIWTDIDGFHNNDPRFVEKTFPIHELSFDEAAELAYFGAKILHPSSVLPAKNKNIPVRLKNTMQPDAPGTLITENEVEEEGEIKAVAAKDGITAVKIKSGRMLLAYGFLRRVFEVFERYKTPIDMITTSEIAVSVTIDNPQYLPEIKKELESYASVEIDRNQSIICVVGNLIAEGKGIALKVINALEDIPLRMISYGGSKHNISVLINAEDKIKALNELNNKLFKFD